MARVSFDLAATIPDADLLEALDGVIERLYREFPSVPLTDLVALVRSCRDDIDTGAPPESIPELVERLARARLTSALDVAVNHPPPELAVTHTS